MKILIKTLVDITETGARRGADQIKSKQQDNYNTAIQTAGFRANLEPSSCKKHTGSIKYERFGNSFKGRHSWWELILHCEYTGAITEEMLIQDFNLVPISIGLEETAKFEQPVFKTNNVDCNIVFILLED